MNEVQDRTDELSQLLSEVCYEGEVVMIDVDAWNTGHVVRIIELLDAELQRRYAEYERGLPA